MRYSYEFKKHCVDLYRKGLWPETPDGVSNDTFRPKVRQWIRLEEQFGPEALQPKRRNRNWTPDDKLELVLEVISGKSVLEVSITHGLSDGLLYQWVRKYKTLGYNGLVDMKKGRKPKVPEMKKKASPKPLTEFEREELFRLRAEIEYIKAENAVIKKEIALREEKAAQLKAKKQR